MRNAERVNNNNKQQEYWEESSILEEIYCQSNTSERPPANTDVKNFQEVNKKL